jgi:shikimate dehydrogenase
MSGASGGNVLTGLIGSPIKSSASPAMHEAAARAAGIRCYYHLVDVPDADAEALRLMLEGVRWLGFAGVNVTYPYKEAVVALLDELAPAARAIGAVNTIAVSEGKLVGHNTDTTGFGRAYREVIGQTVDGPVALIGAGGVGKAAAFALNSASSTVIGARPARSRAFFLREPMSVSAIRSRRP